MQMILLSDLRLVLADLLEHKETSLSSTHAGRLYAPRLHEVREAIEALPAPAFVESRSHSEVLAQTDAEHDALGAAIWHYAEAVRLHPGLADEIRESAQRVRATFIPELSLLKRSYATEAAHAMGKRDRMAEHQPDFDLLPVPGDHETLRTWVDAFVACGESLDSLLRARAKQEASASSGRTRGLAARLRMEAMGLLKRMRVSLGDELARQPETLAAVDAELFGYLDQLLDARRSSTRRRADIEADAAAMASNDGPRAGAIGA